MRPLRLSLKGLRSYRDECTIDFSRGGLVAIVGDTGAGKSSILEAITYALYSGTTWDAREVKQLIADGVQTLSVEFDFIAGGRQYRVHRSTSRTSYPPSVHKLMCLSHPEIPRLDGLEAVNAEIESLLKMQWKSFLTAVVLPQGRFQNLLQAAPAERTRILKGIFRLDEIEAARSQVEEALGKFEPWLNEREKERAALPADPADLARRAKMEARAARDEEKALIQVEKTIKDSLLAKRKSEEKIESLQGPLDRLAGAPSGVSGEILRLLPRAEEIRTSEKALASRREEIEKEIEKSRKVAAERETSGQGLVFLTTFLSSLNTIERDLIERVESKRPYFDAEEKALLEEESSLVKEEVAAKALEKDAARLEAIWQKKEILANESARNLARAESLLREAREERARIDLARRQASRWETDVDSATRRLKAASQEFKEAGKIRSEAEATLLRFRKEHAAAHLARDLSPGDDCPICRRVLPAGYEPPGLVDETPVIEAFKKAEKTFQAATVSKARAEADLTGKKESLVDAAGEVTILEKKAALKLEDLSALIPGADLELKDEEVLSVLVEAGRRSADESRESLTALQAAREKFVQAGSGLEHKRSARKERKQRLETDRREADQVFERCFTQVASLPDFRKTGDARRLSSGNRVAAGKGSRVATGDFSSKQIPLLRETALTLKAEAEKEAAHYESLREELKTTGTSENEIQKMWAGEIGAPVQIIQRDMTLLYQRVQDAIHVTGEPALDSMNSSGDLAGLLAWARSLETTRGLLVTRLDIELTDLAKTAGTESKRIADVLRKAGFRDQEELQSAIVGTRARIMNADKEFQTRTDEVPIATNLDRAIGKGRREVATMTELRSLLADGQFIGHVIQRRQKNLLVVATGILSSMTGGRYGFALDFQVVDQVSHQPRSTKTLSGGESFLASLALALGLVEIAGRSGGRLDSLFLDEGFGALDGNALDEALSALERRAQSGRLVAVVSHLKTVAERIENVLFVSRTPAGSQARWIDGKDREVVVERELEAGLLS